MSHPTQKTVKKVTLKAKAPKKAGGPKKAGTPKVLTQQPNAQHLKDLQEFAQLEIQFEDQLLLDKIHNECYCAFKNLEKQLVVKTRQVLDNHFELFFNKQPQQAKDSQRTKFENYTNHLGKLDDESNLDRDWYTIKVGGLNYINKISQFPQAQQKFKDAFLANYNADSLNALNQFTQFEEEFYNRQAKKLKHYLEQQKFSQLELESSFLREKLFLESIDVCREIERSNNVTEEQMIQGKQAQTLLELEFYKHQILQINDFLKNQNLSYEMYLNQQAISNHFLEGFETHFSRSQSARETVLPLYKEQHQRAKQVYLAALKETKQNRMMRLEALRRFHVQTFLDWIERILTLRNNTDWIKNQMKIFKTSLLKLQDIILQIAASVSNEN